MSKLSATNINGLTPADLDEVLLSGFAKLAGASALQLAAERDLAVAGLVDGRFASEPAKSLLSSDKALTPARLRDPLGELAGAIRENERGSNDRAKSVIMAGDLIVDLNAKTVHVSGTRLHLNVVQYQMIELLSDQKEPISKATFVYKMYGRLYEPALSLIESFVAGLKRKLSQAGSKVQILHNSSGDYVLSYEADKSEHSSVA